MPRWLDFNEIQPARPRDVVRFIAAEIDVDAVLETALGVLSLAAILMLVAGGTWHRWGSVVGLASQPFWIAATWRARTPSGRRHWGMFAISCVYLCVWIFGIGAGFPGLF